jgi:hypothetical protein
MDKIPDAVIEAMCEAGGGSPYWQDYIVHNALKAAEAAGYVLVPVETTPDMHFAGITAFQKPENQHGAVLDEVFAAMLAARPKLD